MRMPTLPVWAIPASVVLVGAAWVIAVRRQFLRDKETPEWRRDEQPPPLIAAGPLANWAATSPPPMSGASNGVSVGARVKYYPGTLQDAGFSIIGEC